MHGPPRLLSHSRQSLPRDYWNPMSSYPNFLPNRTVEIWDKEMITMWKTPNGVTITSQLCHLLPLFLWPWVTWKHLTMRPALIEMTLRKFDSHHLFICVLSPSKVQASVVIWEWVQAMTLHPEGTSVHFNIRLKSELLKKLKQLSLCDGI